MKPRYFLVFFLCISIVFLAFHFFSKKKQSQNNWQFFIRDQIGAQSALNVGKNLSFDQNSIYFIDGKGLLHSLNKQTGQINWQKKLHDHSPFEITLDEQFLYVASFDSHIYQIDKKNGYISWSFAIPGQFWPDSEVIFDKNEQLVFFADRAGILYALDRNSGKLIWQRDFGSIDTSKVFVENSIHFGFLSLKDDLIIADHFPSKTIYHLDKKSGEINKTEKSALKVDLKETEEKFVFDKLSLEFEQNIIYQPKIHLLDPSDSTIWSYRPEYRMNPKEVYQNEQRLYYLDATNTILESIYLGANDPGRKVFSKINFSLNEKDVVNGLESEIAFKKMFEEKKFNLSLELREFSNKIRYLIMNLNKLFSFSISKSDKNHYVEFDIIHQENFYNNPFSDVSIEALFTNQETNQEIKVKGFYYDHNAWKIRARLPQGSWAWQVRVNTAFARMQKSGSLTVTQSFKEPLKIIDGSLIGKDGKIFLPTGIQDVVLDRSKDGNNLNNMDYAKNSTPSNKETDFNYLNLENYLDLYKKEAGLNIFRYGPDNWAPSIWENLSNAKVFAMDVKGNLQGDQLVEELLNRDFRIMMSIFAFYPPYTQRDSLFKKENRAVLEKYLDYVIARYAATIDIWELANEAAPPLEWQNFISDYIREHDPYQHPITTSLEEPLLNNSDLLSIHLYMRKPNSNYDLLTQVEELLSKQDQGKAIIISEFGFQGSNHFTGSADWLRKFAWIMAMKNIGLISWNTGFGLYEHPLNGNVYLGPDERLYLKTLRDFLPDLEPPIEKSFEFVKEGNLIVFSLKDSENELFYLLNLKVEQTGGQELNVKNKGARQVKLLNPKTGIIVSEFELQENETLVKLPNFEDDLSVKITYK